MATEKRLIDANALIAYFDEQCNIAAKDSERESAYVLAALKCCIDLFQNFPTVDAVEVVRCKDCKNSEREYGTLFCGLINRGLVNVVAPSDYCPYGERKDND